MKRSEINRTIELAKEVISKLNLRLPPFAFWSVDDWITKGPDANEIRDCMLGWDVTDFGQGRFHEIGRTLFTLRNGTTRKPGYSKVYAEKLILDPPNQKPPRHFHRSKMEDIINRGGGNILVLLSGTTPDEEPSDKEFSIQVDGQTRHLKPNSTVRLEPGQSINLPPRTIHQFWGEQGTGIDVGGIKYTVSGEVSSVCDDWSDNFWLEPCERFCKVEEDQLRKHYLVHEYPAA